MSRRGAHPQHGHGAPEHHHERKPIDFSYRIVVRTILWLIAASVFVGFWIWWMVT
jgi:hypothetical protein